MAKKIPRAEWDFSECPPNESFECLHWELSRESELRKQDVRQLRKRKRKKTFDAYSKSIGKGIFTGRSGRAMACFYFCPEFPDYPYLSVPPMERKHRLEVLFGKEMKAMAAMIDARTIGSYPYDIADRLQHSSNTGERISFSYGEELALLRIDWHWPDSQQVKFFKEWLKKNRPPEVDQWPNRGRGVPTTKFAIRLRKLAAWRLLQVMDWNEAAKLTWELYCEQGEWLKAARDAKKWLAEIEKFEAERISNSSVSD